MHPLKADCHWFDVTLPLMSSDRPDMSPARARCAITTSTEKQTRKHARYARSYAEYSGLYNRTSRQIKRWVGVGKDRDDLPPLDVPAQMASWWMRNMEHRPPSALLTAGIDNKPAQSLTVTVSAGNDDSSHGDPVAPSLTDLIDEVRRHAARCKRELAAARDSSNPQAIAAASRVFHDAVETQRKFELTFLDVESKRRGLVKRDDVEQELSQMIEVLKATRQNMARRIVAEIERRFAGGLLDFQTLQPFLIDAIETVRAGEDHIFRNLGSRSRSL